MKEKPEVSAKTPGLCFVGTATQAIITGNEMNSERVREPLSRLERLQAMVEREAARVQRICANDAAPVAKKRKGKRATVIAIASPTPEQIGHFETAPVRTERGQVLGHAFRRRPHFETLHDLDIVAARRDKRDVIFTVDSMAALRFYRNAHEGCQRSEMRCPLDVQPRPSSDHDMPPSIAAAKSNLALCERDVPCLDVMRMICLQDMTYEQVAIARFGSRNRDYIINGVSVNRPAPRSTRHTARVKAEFIAGLRVLIMNSAPMTRTGQ